MKDYIPTTQGSLLQAMIAGDWMQIRVKALIIALIMFICFLAVFIDFIYGLSRSRKNGRSLCSGDLKESIKKLAMYYSLLFICLSIDVIIGFAFYDSYIPFVSFGALLVILVTEGLSIWENIRDKEQKELRKSAEAILRLAKQMSQGNFKNSETRTDETIDKN